MRFPLALDEDVYGLGVDFKSMRRNGAAFQLHVDHWGGQPGRTHAPVPFYVSTKGYGVFIDSARYISLNVGVGGRARGAGQAACHRSHDGEGRVVVQSALGFD